MLQVITEEEYEGFKPENRGQAIYFVPDDKLVTANISDTLRTKVLEYAREHHEYLADDEQCYIASFDWYTAVMLIKVTDPFLIFMATMSPDKPNPSPQK